MVQKYTHRTILVHIVRFYFTQNFSVLLPSSGHEVLKTTIQYVNTMTRIQMIQFRDRAKQVYQV